MLDAPNLFNQVLIWPFVNLILLFYNIFEFLKIPGPLGWSIIAITLVIRTVLHPLTKKQMESTYKMQELKPELDKLSKKYKGDKQKLQAEQMRLYKEKGINPASGCLPLLLQFPILIALYRVLSAFFTDASMEVTVAILNKIAYIPILQIETLNLWFFGMNLAWKPSEWKTVGIWILAVPVITGVLQWLQTKQMTPPAPAKKPVSPNSNNKKESTDMASDIQKQMMYLMPIMIGFFAYSFPLGLSLYWNTFTVFALVTMRKKPTNSSVQTPKKPSRIQLTLSRFQEQLKLPKPK